MNIISLINTLPSDIFVELIDNYCKTKKLRVSKITVDDIINIAEKIGGYDDFIQELIGIKGGK